MSIWRRVIDNMIRSSDAVDRRFCQGFNYGAAKRRQRIDCFHIAGIPTDVVEIGSIWKIALMAREITTSDQRPKLRNAVFLASFAIFVLAVFGLLAAAVAPPSVPVRWDEPMRLAFADAADQLPDIHRVAAALTHVGDRFVLLTIAIGVAVAIGVRGQWRLALLWLAVVCSGMLAIDGIKHLVGRPRPPAEFTAGMSPSFPSGHAGGAMVLGSMLAYVSSRSSFRLGKALAVVIVLLAFPIGLTRIILGVHWLSDVFGGWLFGMGWALLGVALLEAWQCLRPQPPAPKISQ
jgi:undecaprenyl-diphosphatase